MRMPYLDPETRHEIFASEISPIELVYSTAFKEATASGERSRAAHIRALEAIARSGSNPPRPRKRRSRLRSAVAAALEWIHDCIEPRQGI